MASSPTRSSRSKKARKSATPAALGADDYCYITTTGRRTGRAHTIEIWFALDGDTIYLLTEESADWVRNIAADPRVRVRIGRRRFDGTGRIPVPAWESGRARVLVLEKYRRWEAGLDKWAETAFPVAIDLHVR
jgi:deazaflavin-dependent oxidoreductase (nitroreductase family)